MEQVSFSLYSLVNSVHIYACITGKEVLRRYSKPYLIPSLIMFYYYTHSLKTKNKLLFTALFLGFLGDTLLLYQITFLPGCFSFFFGNCIYSYLIFKKISKVNYILLGGVFTSMASIYMFIMFPVVKDYLKEMTSLVFLYFIPLVFMMSFSFYNMVVNFNVVNFLLFFAALNFLTSDYILSLIWYVTPIKHSDFYVMVTYLLAQGLLTYGLS